MPIRTCSAWLELWDSCSGYDGVLTHQFCILILERSGSRVKTAMHLRVITLAFLAFIVAGCAGVSSSYSDTQYYLLSFPKPLTPGQQVVEFAFDVKNGSIVAVNRVPYDWNISMLAEAADSTMSGMPNHGASAFQSMAPLWRFVVVRKDRQLFDVTGYIVVTRDFTREFTNYFTTSDFTLERVAPNTLKPAPIAP